MRPEHLVELDRPGQGCEPSRRPLARIVAGKLVILAEYGSIRGNALPADATKRRSLDGRLPLNLALDDDDHPVVSALLLR